MEGLPHLDNGPEVFETSETESIEDLGKVEQVHNEDIDQSSLNAATAQAQFESDSDRALVYEDFVDFLGSLDQPSIGLPGYTIRKQKETREQKLKRIALELQEMESEEKADQESLRIYHHTVELLLKSAEKRPFTKMMSEIIHEIDAEVKSCRTEDSTKSGVLRKSADPKVDPDLIQFEQRINEIENIIGLEALSDHKTLNLHNHLKDLERKIEFIFDPDFEIQAIKDKIESMNSDLEALDIKKRVSEIKHGKSDIDGIGAFEESVNSIYQNVGAMEKYRNILPHMITRLKTLNEIHLDLAGKTQAIHEIDSTLDTISRSSKCWNDNMDRVNSALDGYAKVFKDNVDYVEKKTSDLEQKISAINLN